jgi:serine/threonine protein phosphatase PrpC
METETLTPPARLARIDAFGLSHAGKVRPANEDHFAIMTLQKSVQLRGTNLQDTSILDRLRRPEVHLLIVADGVGGAAGGKIASGVAVRAVVEYLAEAVGCVQDFDVDREQAFLDHLSRAVERGHERLKEMFKTQGGPATTLTMVTLLWPRAYVVHVGDSRGYYLRNGRLRQFTRDQTMGDYLVDIGAVTEQHAQKAGLYNVLSSAVGGDLVPTVGIVDLADGDVLLLCTDGLTKHVPDERLVQLLASGSAESVAQSLIDAALEGGGSDNVTVIVAKAD